MTAGNDWLCRIPPNARRDMRLSSRARRVLEALGRHLDDKGQCWASQTTLGKSCGLARQNVGTGIRELEDLGYVVILGRQNRACRYQVLNADPTAPRAKRKRNKGRRHAPPGDAQQPAPPASPGGSNQNEKILPLGMQDHAPPGDAQTLREPNPPLTPPSKEGSNAPADAGTVDCESGSPDGDHAEAASRPRNATKNQKGSPRREHVSKSKRPSATDCAPKGASGALVSSAANRLGRRRETKPPPQGGFQRVITSDKFRGDAEAIQRLTLLAMEIGEEAALDEFGYDQQGRLKGKDRDGRPTDHAAAPAGASDGGEEPPRAGPESPCAGHQPARSGDQPARRDQAGATAGGSP